MSTDLAVLMPIPPMTPAAIERVREIEEHMLATQAQFPLPMFHVLHAGLYSRTAFLPAGCVLTGCLVKIPTLLIIQGDVLVWLGEEAQRVTGQRVLPASANRKQAFRALADTSLTMVFVTSAETVAEAEKEFTSEWDRLAVGVSEAIITGEKP